MSIKRISKIKKFLRDLQKQTAAIFMPRYSTVYHFKEKIHFKKAISCIKAQDVPTQKIKREHLAQFKIGAKR